MSNDIIHSHQLNYKPVSEANPKYRFLRLPLNQGASSYTISSTGSQLLEFKLPNSVYNLAQSMIGYTVTVPDPAAPRFNWIAEDTFEICTNAYFGTASGLDLCNLNNVSKYVKVARKNKTIFDNYVSNDSTSSLYPSNALSAANFYPVGNSNVAGVVTGVVNYIEPKYLSVGTVGTCAVPPATGTGAITRARLFPLSGLVDTVFSVDKDLYIPTDMYARFTAGPSNLYTFTSTSNADPTAGTPAATAGNVTISSIFLYLAIETNELIVQSVMSKVLTEGLRLNIPYTVGFRNTSSGTSANISLPLTNQYGQKLKQITNTVWHGTESANTALDCNNYNGVKIQNYVTYINSRQLQDSLIVCNNAIGENYDDWRENRRFLRGSTIINRFNYAQNWSHIDRFYEDNKGSVIQEDNRVDGIDMSQPVLYQLQATTTSNPFVHYTFATFNRAIGIDKTGIIPNIA